MALINCPECGKEISDKATACPECGYPIADYLKDKTMHDKSEKCSCCGYENEPGTAYCQKCGIRLSKHVNSADFSRSNNSGSTINIGRSKDVVPATPKAESGSNVLGFVLSIIALLLICAPSYIGVFVGIAAIGTCIPGVRKNRGLAVAGVVIGSFAIVLCLLFSAIRDDRSDNSASAGSTTENKGSASPVAPTTTEDDGIIDTHISDCHIVYIKHEIVNDASGDSCIAIYYEFTNNSSEGKTFSYVVEDKAFQDGIELDSPALHLNDESKSRYSEIKPGVTITVCSAFKLRNETSDVALEINKWISFSDTPKDSMSLSVR